MRCATVGLILLTRSSFMPFVAVSVIAVNVALFPPSRLLAPMTFVTMFDTAVAIVR
jgi:hypothetical protein